MTTNNNIVQSEWKWETLEDKQFKSTVAKLSLANAMVQYIIAFENKPAFILITTKTPPFVNTDIRFNLAMNTVDDVRPAVALTFGCQNIQELFKAVDYCLTILKGFYSE